MTGENDPNLSRQLERALLPDKHVPDPKRRFCIECGLMVPEPRDDGVYPCRWFKNSEDPLPTRLKGIHEPAVARNAYFGPWPYVNEEPSKDWLKLLEARKEMGLPPPPYA